MTDTKNKNKSLRAPLPKFKDFLEKKRKENELMESLSESLDFGTLFKDAKLEDIGDRMFRLTVTTKSGSTHVLEARLETILTTQFIQNVERLGANS